MPSLAIELMTWSSVWRPRSGLLAEGGLRERHVLRRPNNRGIVESVWVGAWRSSALEATRHLLTDSPRRLIEARVQMGLWRMRLNRVQAWRSECRSDVHDLAVEVVRRVQ
jgi:hypothetical protein